jgi:hypothetical protein
VGRFELVPSIKVNDVPAAVHAELRRRAAVAGLSLQGYLLAWLVDETSTPPLDEVLTRPGGRAGGRAPLLASVDAIRVDRGPL